MAAYAALLRRAFLLAAFAISISAHATHDEFTLEGVTLQNARQLVTKAWSLPGGKKLRREYANQKLAVTMKKILTFGLYHKSDWLCVSKVFGRWGISDWIYIGRKTNFSEGFALPTIVRLLDHPDEDVLTAATKVVETENILEPQKIINAAAVYAAAIVYKYAIRNTLTYPEPSEKSYLGFIGFYRSFSTRGSYKEDQNRSTSFLINLETMTFQWLGTTFSLQKKPDGTYVSTKKTKDGAPVISFQFSADRKRLKKIVTDNFPAHSGKTTLTGGPEMFAVKANDYRTQIFRPLTQAELDYSKK